jgi:hypothetical protein
MNPIQRAIKEIGAAMPSVDQCGRDVSSNEYRCGMIHALDILKRNLKGAAMVDVKNESKTCGAKYGSVCFVAGIKCPGLNAWSCPAYTVKGDGE